MASRRENIQNTLKNNGRARTMMVIVGVVVLAMVVFGVLSMIRDEPAVAEQSSVPPPPKVQNIPGASTDDTYNDLNQQDNIRQAEQMRPGDTSLPVLEAEPNPDTTTPWNDTLPTPPGAPEPAEPEPEPKPPAQAPPEQPVYQQPPVQQPAPVVQAPAAPTYDVEALNDRYENTSQQLNNYLTAWSQVPAGAQEFSFNGQKPEEQEGAGGSGGQPGATASATAATASSSGAGRTGRNASGPSLVRAGTVVPAVLLSTVNSDNPGPVLAQITTGPLAGTRLLGTFQNTGKAVVLNFNTMTNPRLGTFGIEALAVDEQYAVGMSTDVDNHYFRRYGLLLAGALLQGYGEAMSRANTVVVTGPLGTTTTQGELDSDEVNAVALGQVGTTLSQELAQQSRVEPTVHLNCKGGCPVGILFMSDL